MSAQKAETWTSFVWSSFTSGYLLLILELRTFLFCNLMAAYCWLFLCHKRILMLAKFSTYITYNTWTTNKHSKTYPTIVIFRVSFRLRIFFKLKLTSRVRWECRLFTVEYFHLDRQWQKSCLSITRKPDTGGLFASQTKFRYKHLCCHFVNAARHYDIESIIGFLSGLLSCVTKKTGPCYWY